MGKMEQGLGPDPISPSKLQPYWWGDGKAKHLPASLKKLQAAWSASCLQLQGDSAE